MKNGLLIAGAVILLLLLAAGLALIVRRLINRSAEKRVAAYQNELMERHYREVENMYRQMRGWRHDYHNHIQTMKAYLSMGQADRLEEYLASLDQDLTSVDTVVKTGNVMVDAILNSKLSMAQAKGISVNAKATVSPELPVAQTDLCVILGEPARQRHGGLHEAGGTTGAVHPRLYWQVQGAILHFREQFRGRGAEKAKRRIPDHKSRQPWLRPQARGRAD